MDGERRDGDGGREEPEVLDEFACAGLLRGSLTSLHGSVERIFGVFFDIGVDDLSQGNNEPIWLKLKGKSNNVKAAKLFVKGVVNPEEQQEVSYPGVLHCVFCGARGLFMDCLIRSTSAHIVIGSSGYLLISGLAEPVVRAYSLITDFAERYEGTQSGRSEVGDRVSGELLDSRRAFKILVEKWEDRHILDLLVLPASVKEILLDLVKESGFDSNSSLALMQEGRWDSTSHHWVDRMGASSSKDSATKDSLSQSVTTSEERLIHFPQEVEEEEQLEQVVTIGTELAEGDGEGDQELQFVLLLKFFTAMGYTEDVVKRVLARTGPKEASQLLDLVQQEQDHTDQEQSVDHDHDQKDEDREMNQHCETVHKDNEGIAAGGDMLINNDGDMVDVCEEERHLVHGCSRQLKGEGSAEKKEKGQEEDFVLGVLKKAAASCGYMEQKVAKVYNMLPDGSTHQLLLELQRDGSNEGGALLEEPREMEDVLLKGGGATVGPAEGETRGEIDLLIAAERRKTDDKGWVVLPKLTVPVSEPDVFTWINKPQQATTNPYKPQPKHHQLLHAKGA